MDKDKQIEEMAKAMHNGCSIVKASNQCRGEDCLDCGAITLYEKGYRKASDFAREIFAEIEKIRVKEIHKCEIMRERENEELQRKYWEGGYNSLRQLTYWFAELKKKYMEDWK